MEIVNIEARTFEAMMTKFEAFVQRVDELCRLHGGKELKKWLDGQEVCQILNISQRTLQTLRSNGTLPYAQINRKIFYKPDDVQRIIEDVAAKDEQHHG